MSRTLRIAMLTHSTNPRGGVVHSMSLAEALTGLGHEVVLHAPDATGNGFFRTPSCKTLCVPVEAALSDMTDMVEQRIADYVRHFENPAARSFDVYHAHDGISGNALATLKAGGLISRFARTVHHIDSFSDPRLMALQDRSIDLADAHFCVSATWQKALRNDRSILATNVGNGVDIGRFAQVSAERIDALRRRLGLRDGPIFLAVGGVEARKNTIAILEAFRQVRVLHADAQLVIAGGASLLDHRGYHGRFQQALAAMGNEANFVHVVGTVADEDMPSLYRLASTLVFPSLKEGFGLVVLEAMASGVPVVVSSIAPFDEYLGEDDVVWCDPAKPASIADAMAVSLMPAVHAALGKRGHEVAARHSWGRVAAAHLPVYQGLLEAVHA
ncbi:MSMEG_0565 family glycosyltransferase [Rhizobium sp. ICMP 5592]|uniref:MSMEG_0565 family glycosyltransferase n=1 Tax=Rhizobium sp. ICMP 5592 TaxID=2292445 RepID=UPI001295A9AA|nr:MSMEG_0565 family glycosyltransferase [Rhizobium sp. ICMP 5592]MQB40499.1 MSMEG_0565 family glycosyltransferase [Rhizobium sp. ICMP 5592]